MVGSGVRSVHRKAPPARRLRPDAEATVEELQEHCITNLGSYKKPRRLVFADEPLPTSAVDKMLRRAARERYFPDPADDEDNS